MSQALRRFTSLLLNTALVLAGSVTLLSAGCARNATGCSPSNPNSPGCAAATPRIIFQFSTQAAMALSNPNVTYYIVLNAPDTKDLTVDPATNGPRINGPSLDFPATALQGRLPFIGLLPGDIASVWTDFYYIQGSTTGTPVVRRGELVNGVPQINQINIPSTLWRRLNNDTTFELQLLLTDFLKDATNLKPRNIAVNLAVSDNIDTGQGLVYDTWLANLPFSISTDLSTTPNKQQDLNNQLNIRQIPGRPPTTLPTGIDPGSLNIVGYEYTVRAL